MQIFLVGQQELTSTLLASEFEQLRQRIIASYHLSALNEQDVEKYIEHRLQKAGWNNDPQIHKDIYKEIYRWTTGIPRKINLICDRLFLYGYTMEKHELGSEDIEQVINDIDKEIRGTGSASLESDKTDLIQDPEPSFSNINLSNMNYNILKRLIDSIAGIESSLGQLVDILKEKKG